MFPIHKLLAAAAVLAMTAVPAAAQEAPAEESKEAPASSPRIIRQDFESITPVTLVGSEDPDLVLTGLPLGWRENSETTSSRARTSAARGATPVRVIRACEISLRLDDNCAAN